MSADHERRLLARARELADTSGLHDDTLACLGAARHAGLDPEALSGLVGCAAALGAGSIATYTAGDGWTGTHPDEHHFLAHIHSIDDDLDEHLHAVTQLGRQAAAALDAARQDLHDAQDQLAAARRQLAAAHALPTHQPCEGCHSAKATTIGAAKAAVHEAEGLVRECEIRTGICRDITHATGALVRQLRHAQARIRAKVAAMSLSLIEGSTLARALFKLATAPSPGGLDPSPWEGTATELLEALRRVCQAHGLAAAELPAGEKVLGQKVREIAPALRRAGVDIRPGRRTGHRRPLIIQQIALPGTENQTSPSPLLLEEKN